MEYYSGKALVGGVAIAQAACLKEQYGVPSLDPDRLRRIAQDLTRFGVEVPEAEQVVLVVDRIPTGLLTTPIAGLEFVAVAGGSGASPDTHLSCPAVCGLGDDFLSAITEGDIVIVDGDRGRVYVSPDAHTLARYQMPTRKTRRVLLDPGHLPARTMTDDRIIGVLGSAACLADVDSAMEFGADAIFIPPGNDILGVSDSYETYDEQLHVLRQLADLSAGQPLFLHITPDRLALSALARAALYCPIHLVIDDLEQVDDLRQRLAANEEIMERNDEPYASIALEAAVRAESRDGSDLPYDWSAFSGIALVDDLGATETTALLLAASAAKRSQKALTVRLPIDDWERWLVEALEIGASRVVVAPDLVGSVKDSVRGL